MPGIEDLLSQLFGAPPAQAAQAADDSAVPTAFAPPANPPMPPPNPFRETTPTGQIGNPDTALGSPGVTSTGAPAGQVLATLAPKRPVLGGGASAQGTRNVMSALAAALGGKSEAATGKWQAFSNGLSAGMKGVADAKAAALKADAERLKQQKEDAKTEIDQKLKINADKRAQLKQVFDQGQTGKVNARENRKLDIQESGKDKTKSDPLGDIKKAEEAKRTLYQRLGLEADDKKEQNFGMPAGKRQALEKQYQDGAARIDAALNAGKSGKEAAAAAPDATPDQGDPNWHVYVNKDTGESRQYNPSTKAWRDIPEPAAAPETPPAEESTPPDE